MNNWVILKHFKTDSGNFTEERGFHDITDFHYRISDFGNPCYVLDGIRLDEYTKEEIPVHYIIGLYENDYIYYNGYRFYTEDFPILVKMIHNRNIEHDLEALE